MNLPKLQDSDLKEKKVLVRADLDIGNSKDDNYRLEAILPTLRYLYDLNCEIILCGHRGRPKGKTSESLGLEDIGKRLKEILVLKWGEEDVKRLKLYMMENLRFSAGEENNDDHYAKHLAEKGDFFVNEAFAASHRKHASIVSLPRYLPHAAGIRFVEEIENLSIVVNKPNKPVLLIVGGIKEDKQIFLEEYTRFADKILVAGRLPKFISDGSKLRADERFVIAKLLPDNEDITIHSIEIIEEEISKAKTIVLAGPIGKFEEEGHRMGTKRVFEAVASSSAFKVAGGGNTIQALQELGFMERFDWVSVGGGATLEFLTKGTLPGIEAIST